MQPPVSHLLLILTLSALSSPTVTAASEDVALIPSLAKRTDTYGNPARLSGPCLETSCVQRTVGGVVQPSVCGIAVVICTAGQITDVNPVALITVDDPRCSYVRDNTDTTGIISTCVLTELLGQLKQSGSAYILFDSVSTITIPVRTITQTNPVVTNAILYVDSTVPPQYNHFITAGSSAIATGGTGGGDVTSTSLPASMTTPASSGTTRRVSTSTASISTPTLTSMASSSASAQATSSSTLTIGSTTSVSTAGAIATCVAQFGKIEIVIGAVFAGAFLT